MTAPGLPPSLPANANATRLQSGGTASARGAKSNPAPGAGSEATTGGPVGEASGFPALFGDLVGGDGQPPDAEQPWKPGLRLSAKPPKKTGGMAASLADALGAGPTQAAETPKPKLVLPSGEAGAILSQPAIPAADVEALSFQDSPSAQESRGQAAASEGQEIRTGQAQSRSAQGSAERPAPGKTMAAQPLAAMKAPRESVTVPEQELPADWDPGEISANGKSASAPPHAVPQTAPLWAPLVQAQPFPAHLPIATTNPDEAPAPQTPPAGPPATESQPDWTKLLDSAATATPPVSNFIAAAAPRPAGSDTAPARLQKPAASSEVPDLAAPRRLPVATEASAPQPDAPEEAAATRPGWMDPVETRNLAFAAHLTPMTASGDPVVADTAASQAHAETSATAAAPDRPSFVAAASFGKASVPAAAPAGTSSDRQQDNASSSGQQSKDDPLERFRKSDLPQSAAGEVFPSASKVASHMAVGPEPQADRLSGQPADSSGSNPLRPKETVELASAPEQPPPAAARDIRLEVNGGGQRVEVRLMERGGEVHVAVRTPDAHLADSLREDLPALSSRLTESGFRTETWRPGASGGPEWHRQAELSAAGSPQDSSGQSRQNGRQQQPGDQPPARQKVPEEQLYRKEKGKDFEWFMSTLR